MRIIKEEDLFNGEQVRFVTPEEYEKIVEEQENGNE